MEFPEHFRCPISMELMEEPVTISTGVTYERKNIQKWFFSYKKKTCPATMQVIENFDITPNHTLRRLILAWQNSHSPSSSSSSTPSPSYLPSPSLMIKRDELLLLLPTIESTPFKVSSLKKLKEIIVMGDGMKVDFKLLGGVEVLFRIIVQILVDNSDFVTFRACEEALAILYHLLSSSLEDKTMIELCSEPESMKSMTIILQRGSAEARFHTISIFHLMTKYSNFNWNAIVNDQSIDMFKSLLELVSDENCNKASSSALHVFIKILDSFKKSRLKAIEAGAVCTLIELLPDAHRSKCEKMLHILKLLCECAEGRVAFIEHRLGVAAITKKMLHVSDISTKICVKILWLICSFHPTDRILEEMMNFGAVKKLVVLLHMTGQSSTKEKVVKLLKLHGDSWRRYPCFPCELKEYLGL